MAGMNQHLNDRIETIFLMADVGLQPIASRLVKEIAIFGGAIHKFVTPAVRAAVESRSEEHTSELQSLMRISYAVFCLKKKKTQKQYNKETSNQQTVVNI